MANCTRCGHNVSDTARFCTRCGSPMMQPGASPEDVATRQLSPEQPPPSPPEQATPAGDVATRQLSPEQRMTGRAPRQPTAPAYLPPGSSSPHQVVPRQQTPAAPSASTVDLGQWLSEAWKVYKNHPATFSAAFLLMLILTPLTLTALTGPMLAGFYRMAFKSMRGERPVVSDIFKGLDRFWPTLFAWLIYAAAMGALNGPLEEYPPIGLIAFALMPILNAIYFFVYPLILEQQQDTATALDKATRVVFSQHMLLFWVCGLIFEILALAGLLGCGVGFLITAPLVMCAGAVAYRHIFGLPGAGDSPLSQPPWMNQEG